MTSEVPHQFSRQAMFLLINEAAGDSVKRRGASRIHDWNVVRGEQCYQGEVA